MPVVGSALVHRMVHRMTAREKLRDGRKSASMYPAFRWRRSPGHDEQFPIDGKIHYGLMRSHLGWRVDAASLWELEPEHILLGDWATDPIRLADYSHSAEVDAALVDGARDRAANGGDGARGGGNCERYAEPDNGADRR